MAENDVRGSPGKKDALQEIIDLATRSAIVERITGSKNPSVPEKYRGLVNFMRRVLDKGPMSAKEYNLGIYDEVLKILFRDRDTANKEGNQKEVQRNQEMILKFQAARKELQAMSEEDIKTTAANQTGLANPVQTSNSNNEGGKATSSDGTMTMAAQKTTAELTRADQLRIGELANGVGEVIHLYGKARIEEDLNFKGVEYEEAFSLLRRRATELEAMVDVNEKIYGEPLDAALAFHKAMARTYGWIDLRPMPGFFGPTPPTMIAVDVGVNETVQVSWGNFKIPGIEGELTPNVSRDESRNLIFVLTGSVKKKNRQQIADLVKLAREILKAESIYKGKAISVTFAEKEHLQQGAPPTRTPKFLDFRHVKPEELVFAEEVQEQMETSLYELIEASDLCEGNGIPLKHTVLLAGEYGVGKSMALMVLGKLAPKHGWTYIHIDSVEHLADAIPMAQRLGPTVLVAEDIDQVVSGERNVDMNVILELIDGVKAKGQKLIIVFTTNHPEKINPAMMRAGRIDAYIKVLPPDANAAIKLVHQYGRGMIKADESLTAVGEMLSGHKPSVIREVVERAKRSAQRRARLRNNGEEAMVDSNGLRVAFNSLKPHLELMAGKVEVHATPIESLLFQIAKQAVTSVLEDNAGHEGGTTVQLKDAEEIHGASFERPKLLVPAALTGSGKRDGETPSA